MSKKRPAADLAGVDQDRVFPTVALTNGQWSKIAKLSGIPEESNDARDYIETIIGIFRVSEASDFDQLESGKVRKELEALAECARDLHHRLIKVVKMGGAYTPLTMGGDGQQLSQVLDVLVGLPKLFLVAAYRVERSKRGPKAGNAYKLVGNLDGIREQYTRKEITRSYKDDASKKYITYVCRIADPDIGNGTIEKAMKDRIKRRGRRKRGPED